MECGQESEQKDSEQDKSGMIRRQQNLSSVEQRDIEQEEKCYSCAHVWYLHQLYPANQEVKDSRRRWEKMETIERRADIAVPEGIALLCSSVVISCAN